MRLFHKDHPFAVEAFFDYSLTLTFAIPKEQLEHLIPARLRLDTFDDRWAFIAVALVQTKGLRPKGFPAFLGSNFFLVGYRVFVKYINNAGRRLRGLYILKSETDSRKMKLGGNLFTHYHFDYTDIQLNTVNDFRTISSQKSAFNVSYTVAGEEAGLPVDSPFSDWRKARKFSGPLPFTFALDEAKDEVVIVEGVRENWVPVPVQIQDCHFDFLDHLGLSKPLLANAFIINNISYRWKKGIRESCIK